MLHCQNRAEALAGRELPASGIGLCAAGAKRAQQTESLQQIRCLRFKRSVTGGLPHGHAA
jgi:hypothetical protein